MSIPPDVPVHTDITTWNEKTQSSPIDPNTIPATPPHTHLHRSTATETMSWDSETPQQLATKAWDTPSDNPNTAHDAALAADMQAAEFSGEFAEKMGGAFGDETRDMPHRRPRAYGTCSHLTPVQSLVTVGGGGDGGGICFGGGLWCHLTGVVGVEPEPEPTMTSDEAWAALVSADQEQDLDDFKVFFLEYIRNNKDMTFVDLEKKFREEGLGVYLIAIVIPLSPHPPLSPFSPSPGGVFFSMLFEGRFDVV